MNHILESSIVSLNENSVGMIRKALRLVDKAQKEWKAELCQEDEMFSFSYAFSKAFYASTGHVFIHPEHDFYYEG